MREIDWLYVKEAIYSPVRLRLKQVESDIVNRDSARSFAFKSSMVGVSVERHNGTEAVYYLRQSRTAKIRINLHWLAGNCVADGGSKFRR